MSCSPLEKKKIEQLSLIIEPIESNSIKRVQWNPVNTVSNGPKRIGRLNGLGSISLDRHFDFLNFERVAALTG